MNFILAKTDTEIESCFPVFKELRQDLVQGEFVSKIRELENNGYMILYIEDSGKTVSVAGFRLGESLSWKRYLYIDDLVTLASERSKAYGSKLLDWLTNYAIENGCVTLHLDSGVDRKDAHRFYEREGMQIPAYHFMKILNT